MITLAQTRKEIKNDMVIIERVIAAINLINLILF
jgi:hypothetical protein